jgi:hypothetical protein
MIRVVFLWSMLVGYAMSALVGVLLALAQTSEVGRLLGFSLVLSGAMTVLFFLAVLRENSHRSLRWLMLLGMGFTVPAALIWLVMVTGVLDRGLENLLSRFGGGLTFLALWCVYVGYCFVFPVFMSWYRCVVWFLVACSLGYLTMLELLMVDEDIVESLVSWVFPENEVFFRLLAALIVLSSAGSLALPVVWLIQMIRRGGEVALGPAIEIDLTCPRCGLDQPIPVGIGACTQCRLEIRVKVEEPRCECGFLLYRFEGDACPECGREVPSSLRWSASGP